MDAEIIKDSVDINKQEIQENTVQEAELINKEDDMKFYDGLIEALMDEFSDVDKYYCLAKQTECGGYSQILKDIAKEEWQHAKHIEEILMDACEYKASQELKDLKVKAKEAMNLM